MLDTAPGTVEYCIDSKTKKRILIISIYCTNLEYFGEFIKSPMMKVENFVLALTGSDNQLSAGRVDIGEKQF